MFMPKKKPQPPPRKIVIPSEKNLTIGKYFKHSKNLTPPPHSQKTHQLPRKNLNPQEKKTLIIPASPRKTPIPLKIHQTTGNFSIPLKELYLREKLNVQRL